MTRRWMCLAFAMCVSAPAVAMDVAGVALADDVSVGGRTLVLNGAGVRSKWLIRIYVGSLYLPERADDLAGVLARQPRRIQMNLLRELTADQLVGALLGGLRDNNTATELAAVKAPTEELVRILTRFKDANAKENDVLTMDFVDGGTWFAVNGEIRGVVSGEAFNNALTRIWLGHRPAQRELKKAMLGG